MEHHAQPGRPAHARHDADGLALLVIGRRDEPGEVEADSKRERHRAQHPGQQHGREAHEARRIRQFDQASHGAASGPLWIGPVCM